MVGRSARNALYRKGAAQRAELVFPAHAAAAVLRPYGEQIVLNGSGHVDRRDMAQGRMESLGKPHRVAVEGEYREPLVAVVADPHRICPEANATGGFLYALRLGGLADDRNIRL
jgi:hypothetical protein